MTTATVYLDTASDGVLTEVDRNSFDGIARQPREFRAGVGLISAGGSGTVDVDDVSITEDACAVLPDTVDYDCNELR